MPLGYTPHSLRRSFATYLLDAGTDLVLIQNLLPGSDFDAAFKLYLFPDTPETLTRLEQLQAGII